MLNILGSAFALAAQALAAPPVPAPITAQAAPPAVAVVSVREPDRGGRPNDGDLWRRSTTVALTGPGGGAVTDKVVANTPIPDSAANRARFGGPDSQGGRRTAPRPGPVAAAGTR